MNRDNQLILLAALFLGVVTVFISGAMFLVMLFAAACYLIYNNSPADDRRFIMSVLIAGFILRVFLAAALHAIVFLHGFHGISGDDLLYTLKGWGIVCGWENRPTFWLKTIFADTVFGLNPYTYIIAAFYKFFGFHPVTVKIINCGIGTSIGWIAYLFASSLFNKKVARIAMLITVFYPSLIRWSVANLKDPITIVLFLSCLYILVIGLQGKIQLWKYGLLLSLWTLLYYFANPFHFALVMIGIVLFVFLKLFQMVSRVISKKTLLAIVVTLVIVLTPLFLYTNNHFLQKFLFDCEKKQACLAMADYAGYYLYTNELVRSLNSGAISMPELLAVISANVFYYMFTPFPLHTLGSKERLAALPQMLLWYLILFLGILGFVRLVLEKPKPAILLGCVLFIGIVINALVEGNIGSAFRHRDIFTVFFILFASSAFADLMCDMKDAGNKRTENN